jgi:hypothetical protein
LTKARDVATQGGLVLINTTTLSAASSYIATNLVANTRYRVVFSGWATNNGEVLNLRFRQGSTDVTSGYFGGSFYMNYLGTSGNYLNDNNGGSARVANLANDTNFANISFDLITIDGVKGNIQGTGFAPYGGSYAILFGKTIGGMTAANGFNLFVSSGTMTGKISLYKYSE